MKISRYFGITTREAMRQVRLALGPDALIISNRRVEGGVEILATDASSVPEADAPTPVGAQSPNGQGPGAQSPAPQPPGARPPVAESSGLQAPGAPYPSGQNSEPMSPQGASTRTSMFSPTSPLGAYAAAFQAAYGEEQRAEHAERAAPLTPAAAPEPPLSATASGADGAQSTSAAPASGAAASHVSTTTFGAQPPPDIMDAIGAMRGALESRIDELMWGNQLRRAPQAATLFPTLLGFGFSTALLRAMLQRLPEQLSSHAALEWVRQELISHLPVLADEDELWKPGLALALVGPTGVGKTTTIAKLAARCVRRFGPDKLVLITTDTYRIGAHEQLKIYGQMLRTPVHVVRSADEMRTVVSGVRPDQVILIDNVGISQRDRYIAEQAAMLAAAGRDVARVLVLNAASHGETLDEVARSYRADGGTPLKGCIITKVDEATRLGAVLDTVIRYRLPIHYVSIGQKVPEHLVFLKADELVDQALTHLPSARSLYAPTEADLAALMAMTQPPQSAPGEGQDVRRAQIEALPRLLSLSGGGAAKLTPQDLRAGCAFIDELPAAAKAFALWRQQTAPEYARQGVESEHRQMLRIVQNAWAEAGTPSMLAVHDQTSMRAAGEPTAQLRATLILDARGVPLVSPVQQLTLPSGWLSSSGEARAQSMPPSQALLEQMQWLAEHASELPMVHLFEGGNPALWGELAEGGMQWMAQVPAITRLYMEDGATTVQAYAKTLSQRPVTDPAYLFALNEVAGGPASERALWVASSPVQIARRGSQPLPLNMVSARLVEKSTGKEVRRVIGLHAGLDVSLDTLAAWLVIKAESRDALRHAGAAWGLLAAQGGQTDPLRQALAAAQSGMAAWQLNRHPAAQQGRQLASVMLGKASLRATAATAATFQLFALKEMLDVG